MHSFTTVCLPSDLQLWSPEHLIPFDPVCHSGCNCHSLKAFKTIKSFSVLGAWQYISALIRTLGCQRNCPPRANPAPRGAVPTKLIILCNHTSWKTATASGKYRFGGKHNAIPALTFFLLFQLTAMTSNISLSFCHNNLSLELQAEFLYLIEFFCLRTSGVLYAKWRPTISRVMSWSIFQP